ncbi:hypothetical protein [Prevotella sp. 10(H)]|uniref:hypothetical protein n=1 Tax=Prevotella sp. 10(H) TaxID=1158294 RepID=UPI000AB05ED9|nr:hypothetical protein [Prevotella sp. 10(H)]
MKSSGNQSHTRGSYAENGPRDAEGKLEKKDAKNEHSSSQSSSHSQSSTHRGENAKNEQRDSQGRFESKDDKKK